MNKAVKGDILKSSESGRLIDDPGTLQYLVILPNEEGHRFHYTGEAASIIQPIDERVADCIRLQIREGCKTPKGIQWRVTYFVKENIFGGLRVKQTQRNKSIPSRKKIRNLILSVRNETRYSKIDQDNIEHVKEQWMKNGDVFFLTLHQTKFWRGANRFDERYFSYFLHFHIGPRCKHGDSKVVFLSFIWKLL